MTSLFPQKYKKLALRDTREKRVIRCKVRNVKKIREFKVKEEKRRKVSGNSQKSIKRKNPAILPTGDKNGQVETPTTYKLFRVSVLQNNRFFRKSEQSIVMPILSQFQRKRM